jgi:hypothetical protein
VAGINAVNVSLGHAPIDAAAVHTIVGEGISTVVDTANALHAQGTVAAAAPPTGLELHTGPADPA